MKKTTKISLNQIFLGLLTLVAIGAAIKIWSTNLGGSLSLIIGAVICLFSIAGQQVDKGQLQKGKATEDERDTYVELKTNNRVLKWLQWILFVLFIIFMIFYFIDNHNLILGVIGILSGLYWSLSWILQIILAFIENSKS
mgnify:CR=1 FL=1